MAGISTCALGHADPDLAAAVGDQMKKFHHVSNLYYIPEQVPRTCGPSHSFHPIAAESVRLQSSKFALR